MYVDVPVQLPTKQIFFSFAYFYKRTNLLLFCIILDFGVFRKTGHINPSKYKLIFSTSLSKHSP